jgi:RimJ/RimL family protein N-acetyltransferase/ferredoxin
MTKHNNKKHIFYIHIEQGCIGCRGCAYYAPDIFTVTNFASLKTSINKTVLEKNITNIITAAHNCPVRAIKIYYSEYTTQELFLEHSDIFLEPMSLLCSDQVFEYIQAFSPTVKQALNIPHNQIISPAEAHIQLIEYFAQEYQKHPQTITWNIRDKSTNTFIGSVSLRPHDHPNGMLGAWLNEHYWRKGLYQQVLKLVTTFYFDHNPNSPVITIHIDKNNLRSIRAHTLYGFKQVSTRDNILIFELNHADIN